MINVLVTAVGGLGVGQQIVKSLRLETGLSFKIVGTDIQSCEQNNEYIDKFVAVPPANSDNYLSEILSIIALHNIQIVFCGSEPELWRLSENKNKIEAAGAKIIIADPSLLNLTLQKFNLSAWLESNEFPYLKSILLEDFENIPEINFFPIIVKPNSGSSGSKDVYIAQSLNELNALLTYLDTKMQSKNIVLQEYIGSLSQEYTVGMLYSDTGEYINSIAMKRDLTGPLNLRLKEKNKDVANGFGEYLGVSTGISMGHLGKYPEITNFCKKVCDSLKVSGPINLQCRFHAGEVYIFEINPRHSGTTFARALAGLNEPVTLIKRHVLDQTVLKDFTFTHGYFLRSIQEEFRP